VTLRTRLFISSGLVAVPLVVGSFLLDERLRLNAMEDALRSTVANDLAFGLKDRCESGIGPPPGGRGGPPGGGPGGRGGYLPYTYAADGTTRAGSAPALPAETVSTFWTGLGRGLQLRFEIGGSGNCAIGLARMPPRPGQFRDQLVAVGLVVLSVLGGVWIAAGPVITRMRRLADQVQLSATSSYAQPVPVEHDDEVAALARAFNEAGATVRLHFKDVQAREQTLRQFVASTTHDVAMPMLEFLLQTPRGARVEARRGRPGPAPAARLLSFRCNASGTFRIWIILDMS
jgi:HAMP domain-containing protein